MERTQFIRIGGRYLIALIAPAAVVAVMNLSWPFFQPAPIALFFIAITFSAWYGGIGPGMVSVAISLIAADYFF